MVKLNRIIVHAGKELVLDMKRMPDGSWKTLTGVKKPAKKKRRPKTGRMARLMRQHKKWLQR